MKFNASYFDKDKTSVICEGDFNGLITRGHRFWSKYGIDELEKNNLINPFVERETATKPSKEEIRNQEMESELTWTMIQRQYHDTNDEKRMIYALGDLNKYAIQCRDHVTHDENGDLVIVGEIPKRPEPIK